MKAATGRGWHVVGWLFLFGVWESLSFAGLIPSYLAPAPSEILAALWGAPLEFAKATLETLTNTLVGLLLSFLIGSTFGVVLSLSDFLRRFLLPIFVLFQTVPIVAIAPLLVIWFGFGGGTVRASALICSIFPILVGVTTGLREVRRDWLDLFLALKASPWQIFWRLRVPVALLHLFSSLRVAAGLAVVGAIVGEFIAGGGLGSLIDSARTQQRLDLVFGALVCSSLLGLGLLKLVAGLQDLVTRWKPFHRISTDA